MLQEKASLCTTPEIDRNVHRGEVCFRQCLLGAVGHVQLYYELDFVGQQSDNKKINIKTFSKVSHAALKHGCFTFYSMKSYYCEELTLSE